MIHVVNSVYYETNFDLTKSGDDGIIPSLRIDDKRSCNPNTKKKNWILMCFQFIISMQQLNTYKSFIV